MRFFFTLLLLLLFAVAQAQETGLPFQNLQQVNPAYAGTEGDFNLKSGLYYNEEEFGTHLRIYAASSARLPNLNSAIGVTAISSQRWYQNSSEVKLGYNYRIKISDGAGLRIGSNFEYRHFSAERRILPVE